MTPLRPLRLALSLCLLGAQAPAAEPRPTPPAPPESVPMAVPPSSSRPAPPVVPPVEHGGVRYQQDTYDERRGDQQGGYLVALDARTGERLWRLRVYPVADHRAAGVTGGSLHFRALRLADSGRALEIENEVGSVYRVVLATRAVTHLAGPTDAPSAAPAPLKPKPKPE